MVLDQAAAALLADAANALNGLNIQNVDINYESIGNVASLVGRLVGTDQAKFVEAHLTDQTGDYVLLVEGWRRARRQLSGKPELAFVELSDWVDAMRRFSRPPAKMRIDKDAPRRKSAAGMCLAIRTELVILLDRRRNTAAAVAN